MGHFVLSLSAHIKLPYRLYSVVHSFGGDEGIVDRKSKANRNLALGSNWYSPVGQEMCHALCWRIKVILVQTITGLTSFAGGAEWLDGLIQTAHVTSTVY